MNTEKIYRYVIAGIFGLVGFSVAYIAFGWLAQPIQEWIYQKFEGVN